MRAREVRLRLLAADHRVNLADTDGNPATIADPSWVPLIPTGTPPYPEYPSGYNVFTSTVTHGLENLFQTCAARKLDRVADLPVSSARLVR